MLQAIIMQYQGKLLNQTWENGKKPSSGPNFGIFEPNSGQKKKIFFSKNLALSVTRYHGQLSWYATSEKKWSNFKKS